MNARLAFLCCLLLIGNVAGFSAEKPAPKSSTALARPRKPTPKAPVRPAQPPRKSAAPSKDTAVARRAIETPSATQVPANLAEALAYPSNLHRQYAVQVYFESLPVSQYPMEIQQLLAPDRVLDLSALQILLRLWVARAPAEAASRVMALTPEQGRSSVLLTFARAWARFDPAAAEAWASSLPRSDRMDVSQIRNPMKRNEKPVDPQLAFQEYLKSNDTSSANATLYAIFDTWAKTNPTEAGAAALTLSTKTERERAIGSLLQVWSRSDPRAALAWMRDHPDESLLHIFSTYAQYAALFDLQAVKDAAASAQDPAEKQRLNVVVANQLVKSDLDGAIAFLESIPPEDRRLATQAYREWAERDPAAAVAAYRALYSHEADSGKNSPALAPQLRYLFDVWIQKDPAAAAAAVLEVHKADPPELLFEVAQKWCRTDASAAAFWAAGLPEGPVRDEVLKQFMSVWSQHDYTRASAFLVALPAGTAKSAAAEAFAFSVIATDPDGALIMTRAISERSKRLDVLRRAWTSWHQKDPAAANDWLKNSNQLSRSERAAIRQ